MPLYPYISPASEGMDIYNFSLTYPYADAINTLQRQMVYFPGVIQEIRATFGAIPIGASTGTNRIDVLNNSVTVLTDNASGTILDLNTAADVICKKTAFISGTTLVAGTYLGVRVYSLKTDGTGSYGNLLVQVIVKRT